MDSLETTVFLTDLSGLFFFRMSSLSGGGRLWDLCTFEMKRVNPELFGGGAGGLWRGGNGAM